MIQALALIFGILLISIPATAQIYENKATKVTSPLDHAIELANNYYSNIASPGDDQNTLSQEVRYKEMTNAVNQANEDHFNIQINELR